MQNLEHSDGSKEDMGQRRLIPWYSANMTAWLYECAKKPIRKQSLQFVSDKNYFHKFCKFCSMTLYHSDESIEVQ